jgi:hypothetical protein
VRVSRIVNFVVFEAGWLACVLAAAHGDPWLGVGVVAAIAAFHVTLADAPVAELALLGVAALIGAMFDSGLVAAGLVRYPGAAGPFAPPWIVAMWVLFATTLDGCLAWLQRRPYLAIILGAAGGPLAYLGGQRLGALILDDRSLALLALAVGWGALTPTLLAIAARLTGNADPASSRRARRRASHA